LRPALEIIEFCQYFGDRPETGIEDVFFTGRDGRVFDVNEVHDAKVDLTDGRLVVVDEADALLATRRLDSDFFVQFAAHALRIDGMPGGVFGIEVRDVPPHADAPEGVQSLLALTTATRVLEKPNGAAGVGVAKDDVRDELFEARVLFHFGARSVADGIAFKQRAEVTVDVAGKPLEMAQVMEQRSRNNENSFGLD
jgi:hypothetical protein